MKLFVATKIQKVDGSVEENNNGDLFWAVRGGGLAFGVITQYKIKLHQPPPKVASKNIRQTTDLQSNTKCNKKLKMLYLLQFMNNAFVQLRLFASIDHPVLGNVAKDLLDFYGDFVKNLTNNWGGYLQINSQPGNYDH